MPLLLFAGSFADRPPHRPARKGLGVELFIADLAELCGAGAVTITTPDGIIYDNCYLGAEGPGSGVVVRQKSTVMHENTEKVLAVLTVSGHIEY